MNFLLQMLGRPHRNAAVLRPSGNERLRNIAATAAAAGRLPDALNAYRQLVSQADGSLADLLTRAHLHLSLNEYSSAFTCFSAALTRLDNSPLGTLENQMDAADEHLRQSHFVRATAMLQSARNSVDMLLAAHAGLAVAGARMTSTYACATGSILPLAKLGDLLLRMLARTHLASNLAICLREQSLRHDLAAWATSANSVDNLLKSEFAELQKSTRANPSHAELHYRLGLVARTLGDLPAAIRAFSCVLSLHPHHIPSAARFAATHLQLGQKEKIFPVLAVAFAVPPNILEQYAALAASSQTATFDNAADRYSQNCDDSARATVKANLAFALAELGLLDPTRAEWREAVPA